MHGSANKTGFLVCNFLSQERRHPESSVARSKHPSPERLDLAISYSCERTLTHAGIELNNLRYNSPALLPIRHHFGKKVKVQVRYNKQNLTYIHVLDPVTQAPIPVPALDQEYVQGLTLIQHNLIWKHLRKVMEEDRSKPSLLRAKAELRALVQEMSLSKSVRQRQKSAKIRSIGQERQDWLDRQPHRLDGDCLAPIAISWSVGCSQDSCQNPSHDFGLASSGCWNQSRCDLS